MHPTQPDQTNLLDQENRAPRTSEQVTSQPSVQGRRFRTEDSWIEISSQPPSTSLCAQDNNNIVTTGLRLRSGGRQMRLDGLRRASSARSNSVAGSSQDEYEESESESDRVLSSSNEDILQQRRDDDEQATTLGVEQRDVFTPQPNAFSHPPQPNHARSTPTPGSYFPPVSRPSHTDRLPSNRMVTQQAISQRTLRRELSSSMRPQPDHEAALRASLTTLLSCAAAVRPQVKESKADEGVSRTRPSSQPTTLRLVPESELDTLSRPSKPMVKRRSRESSKERHAKKVRSLKANSAGEEVLSPTVMTWMISAGVVLVFSAISFSAGYAWGKEVGRVEGQIGLPSGSCGPEAMRGGSDLRKLRWSGGSQSVRA